MDSRHKITLVTICAAAGVAALAAAGRHATHRHARARMPIRDYSRRSGLPRDPEQMRGVARTLISPPDMRIPAPLRPW